MFCTKPPQHIQYAMCRNTHIPHLLCACICNAAICFNSWEGFTLKNNTFGKWSHCNADHIALNVMFQPTSHCVYEWLLSGCDSQTPFFNHGSHRPSIMKQLYPPVPHSSTCIWLKYSAELPALPCMYNYRICCLPLITLPNNVWRGKAAMNSQWSVKKTD